MAAVETVRPEEDRTTYGGAAAGVFGLAEWRAIRTSADVFDLIACIKPVSERKTEPAEDCQCTAPQKKSKSGGKKNRARFAQGKTGGNEEPEAASEAGDALEHEGGKRRGGSDAPKPLDPDSQKALAGLTTTTDECAPGVAAPGTPCASKRLITILADFIVDLPARDGEPKEASSNTSDPLLPTVKTEEATTVRVAAAALGCDSETCVIGHPEFRRFASERGVTNAAINEEIAIRYKVQGPRNSTRLTSNFNLDGTLQQWAREFDDFYPCPYAMMDFERNGDVLGKVDVRDALDGRLPVNLGVGELKAAFTREAAATLRKAKTFACILNTDVISGPGKHWVAVFVDTRTPVWTVEYFNSAGNPPTKAVTRWMETTRAKLLAYRGGRGGVESVPVTDVDHQESQTECGLYALYYVRRRLEGVPYGFFFDSLVPDAAMTEFRKHVFRR